MADPSRGVDKGSVARAARSAERQSIGGLIRSLIRPIDARPARDAREVIKRCRALLSERGEVSGARLATDFVQAYRALDDPGREVLFDLLVAEFSLDPKEVGRAAEAYRSDPSEANLVNLQDAVEAPRQELFRRINMAEAGTAALIDMRRRLLTTLDAHPERAGVDADLLHLFRSWFNRGFLSLQRIEWRTPALVLERLIQYEAVHQIQGWRDLRRRLEADRRCYAFFHPVLPDEPLIFIEVALVRPLPTIVQPLLDPEAPVIDPAGADCAVFYSITNCQEGLRGVSFGNFLIKHVVEELGRDFPYVKTFATLSPVPGFAAWLMNRTDPISLDGKPSTVQAAVDALGLQEARASHVPLTLQKELTHLCANYLLHAKRGKNPLDAVARFHLANGASLERLNWMGDTSAAGLRRSIGFTVNYVYKLTDVERNHEAYARAHTIRASNSVERIARGPSTGPGPKA